MEEQGVCRPWVKCFGRTAHGEVGPGLAELCVETEEPEGWGVGLWSGVAQSAAGQTWGASVELCARSIFCLPVACSGSEKRLLALYNPDCVFHSIFWRGLDFRAGAPARVC